jgi:hypothetical protein
MPEEAAVPLSISHCKRQFRQMRHVQHVDPALKGLKEHFREQERF